VEAARPALPGDLPACTRLLEEARDRLIELRGGPELLAACTLPPAPEPVGEQWVTDRWRGPQGVLLVGTIDGVVVGLGAGRVATHGAARVGTIDCCYVEPAARGVGVGGSLAESLVRWFVAKGCAAVDAAALPGDRGVKQLFESQGLSARLLVLHRRLP
jgi:GNAT superfamily N-acetyltransferase